MIMLWNVDGSRIIDHNANLTVAVHALPHVWYSIQRNVLA